MKPERIAQWLALVAGLTDFLTGLGLVLAPTLTLSLMLVPVPGAEALVFLRFVGAFVGAVGASYVWALLAPALRLRAVLGVTVLFRLSAGSYVLWAVLSGSLPPAWLSVTLADYGLAAVQSWLLRRLPLS